MKGILPLTLALGATLMTLSLPANAQYGFDFRFNNRGNFRYDDGGIDARQSRLQARINRGIADGRLSPYESARLQARLDRIARMEARMRSTGYGLNGFEINMLNNQLSNLSDQVAHDLNDFDRVRTGYWGDRNWY